MNKKFIAVLFGIMLFLCLFSACEVNSDIFHNAGGNSGGTEQDGGTSGEPEQDEENSDGTDGTEESEDITEMYIYVNDSKLKVTLAENSSTGALVKILKQGDITYTAHANGFEIYGNIGHDLSTDNDTYLTSQAGDVFLWAGDNICIFFGNNSYSYTRIGRIEGYTASALKAILAASNTVQVTISLK